MNKIFSYCFDKWWRPLIFWILTVLLYAISEILRIRIIENISFFLFGIGLIVLLVSAVYQFTLRKWLVSFFTFSLFCGTIFAFLFYAAIMFWIEQEEPDTFADKLTIPTNIEIKNPLDLAAGEERPESIKNLKVSKINFQLYNSFQSGLYEYDFWIGRIESGTIYLKAYEITQEYQLSKNSLYENSALRIYNATDTIVRFGTKKHFTIYEGDWGKPYAARFEVWFKPDDGNAERKIFEQNYRIEGWMR